MNHSAPQILQTGMTHLADRAKQYDAPAGERSMADTVAMFNTLTKNSLSERDGWQFMELLKMVRSRQGHFKVDTYEDGAAYAALAGEAAAREAARFAELDAAMVTASAPALSVIDGGRNVDDAASSKATGKRAKPPVQKPARRASARRR